MPFLSIKSLPKAVWPNFYLNCGDLPCGDRRDYIIQKVRVPWSFQDREPRHLTWPGIMQRKKKKKKNS